MFRNMKIGPRLIIGFGMLATLILILGAFSLHQMGEMHEDFDEVSDVWLPSIDTLASMNLAIMRYRAFSLRQVIDPEPAALAKTQASMRDLLTKINDLLRDYERYLTSDEERQLFNQLVSSKERFIDVVTRVGDAVGAGDLARGKQLLDTDQRLVADELTKLLLRLGDFNTDGATAAALASDEIFATSRIMVMTTIALSIALTVGLGCLLLAVLSHR